MMPENNQATFHIPVVVVSGRGIASREMQSGNDTFKIKDRLFVPGTLNLVANKPIVFEKKVAEIEKVSSIYIYTIHLNGIPCCVRRYSHCPLHIFEVISETQLRNTLALDDGDVAQLKIAYSAVKPIGLLKNMLWHLAWKGREFWFYKFDWYPKFISRFLNFRYRFLNMTYD